MSDTVRMQFDAEGNIVESGFKPETPAPTPAQHPRGALRYVLDTESGVGRFEESHTTGGTFSPSVVQATARDRAGNPISLSAAKPTDVVAIPGFGDTTAEVFEGMGLLRRGAFGYEVVGSAATQETKPAQETKPQAAPEPAGDVRGVEGTSEATDATMKALSTVTPQGLDAIVSSLSTTGEISDALLSDLASQHDGSNPEEFKAGVVSAINDHVRAAQQAIRNVDASISPEAFQAWLQKNPDLASHVVRGVMAKSVAEVQSAARQYSAARDTALEAALNSRGITTKREAGKLYVSRASLGLPVTKRGDFAGDLMPVSQAIRENHIIINEVK